MTDPFTVLNVLESASEKEIKTAFLAKVREFPPERSPQQFQAIRDAYEVIKTEKLKLAYQLFHSPEIDGDTVYRSLLKQSRPGRPSEEQFKGMLADTIHMAALPDSIKNK